MYSYYLPKNFPRKAAEPVPQPAEPSGEVTGPRPSPVGSESGSTGGYSGQHRTGQAAHQWRVNGFSPCSHTCAGGKGSYEIQPLGDGRRGEIGDGGEGRGEREEGGTIV